MIFWKARAHAPKGLTAAHPGCASSAVGIAALFLWSQVLFAQQSSQPRPADSKPDAAKATAAKPPDARAQAPFDLSGYWVSLITQNWRYRMVVPGPGEFNDLPINQKGKRFSDAYKAAIDEAAGKQCEAYGAAAIMRQPGRLHIHWLDSNNLRVDTDTGMQTRLLHFNAAAPGKDVPPSLQGYTVASWQIFSGGPAPAPAPAPGAARYGSLETTTDHMLPGLLRKNGVPYSGGAKMTEIWDLRTEPTGDQWLSISTRVEDSEYLQAPYTYDSIFQREADAAKWDPMLCSLTS